METEEEVVILISRFNNCAKVGLDGHSNLKLAQFYVLLDSKSCKTLMSHFHLVLLLAESKSRKLVPKIYFKKSMHCIF